MVMFSPLSRLLVNQRLMSSLEFSLHQLLPVGLEMLLDLE